MEERGLWPEIEVHGISKVIARSIDSTSLHAWGRYLQSNLIGAGIHIAETTTDGQGEHLFALP
jgi:hypothetical protein